MKRVFILWGVVSCGSESLPTPEVAHVRDYRDDVCQVAAVLPADLSGVREVRVACQASDDLEDVVRAFACADDSRDLNMELARQAEVARQSACLILTLVREDSAAIEAARGACREARPLRSVALAFVGGECPES